jgi:hypothetical protein
VFPPRLNRYSIHRPNRRRWKRTIRGLKLVLACYSPGLLCCWILFLLGCSSFRGQVDFGLRPDPSTTAVPLDDLVEQGAELLWNCMFERSSTDFQTNAEAALAQPPQVTLTGFTEVGTEATSESPLELCLKSAFGWLLAHPDTELVAPIPYLPQEGDIVITTSCCLHVRLFKLAGTGHPLHVGLLVKNEQGELTLFESTVVDRGVTMFPAEERFQHFLDNHRSPLIWVRPIRKPLTAEQSEKLTQFALSQRRKGFAFMRSAAFVLPVERIHRTSSRQWTWFCTELTIEGASQAELLNTRINPATVLPEDIYHNRKIDLSAGWLPATTWSPDPVWPTDRPKGAPLRPDAVSTNGKQERLR